MNKETKLPPNILPPPKWKKVPRIKSKLKKSDKSENPKK